ncbi:DNA excision repair protein ERCC-1 [Pseudohyphozyma bogoriensis]|nr:DNA excision repair protein ERCC-1 [Pseudohyphozyma bogoriensis]
MNADNPNPAPPPKSRPRQRHFARSHHNVAQTRINVKFAHTDCKWQWKLNTTPAAGSATPTPLLGPSAGSARVQVQGAGPGGVVRRQTLNAILINVCQKGNPVISSIRNVPWEYGDIVPDYQVGTTSGVLYLSLRYHLLHPEYIHGRIAKMGQSYSLRIMMVHCDVDNHMAAMRELNKVCLVNNFTMIVVWSAQEAGKYLEIYKAFERKPPDLIKERVDDDYMSRLTAVLTSIKGVNKTDVVTLASNYGTTLLLFPG